MIARFNAENPDLHIDVNVVAWPGYPQLTAQMAARDPPDLVTMHEGVITDYAAKGLLEPVDGYLRAAGISPTISPTPRAPASPSDGNIYALPWDTHGGLFHVNTALFAKAGLMRGGKPILPNSRRRADRPGAPVRAAHRQALSHPEHGRRPSRRRPQPIYLHDGAGRGAVPRSRTTSSWPRRLANRSPPFSSASTTSISAPATWIRPPRSPLSSTARAASIRPAPG